MVRTGAVGALLDIYEKAIADFKQVIIGIPDDVLTTITDPETTDANCRSVQSILSHVVNSGYYYSICIHNIKGPWLSRPDKVYHLSIEPYIEDLDEVFAFTENVFKHIKDPELEEFDDSLKMKTSWGQRYDIEQLMEHAIVHVLRHKRQLERIKRDILNI